VTLADEGLDVAVMGVSFPRGADTMRFAPLLLGSGIARLTFGAELVFQTSAPTLRIGRARVRLQPAGFLQATVEGEAALAASVAEAVSGAKRVIDLFAGIGTFALRMAEKAEVHASDGDRDAIAALTAAWRGAPGLRRLTAEARDLFRRPLEAEELRGADAIVIDPPRAGAEAQTAALARAGVPVIAAVSCNPVTFARDAKALVRAGYRIDWVQPVDQFRWSPHLELAARFSLPGA
jgi:23S rRNA (uracil1939-C5)-methyltransferase